MFDSFSVAPNITAKLQLAKFPDVEFATQKTPIPTITAIYPKVQAPQINVPMPLQSLKYGLFSIEFILFEDCSNYRTLVDWMQSALTLDVTDSFTQGSLILLSANRNPVQTVVFTDLICVDLSQIDYEVANDVVQYQKCIATFDYTKFNFQ